ncbi:MAG: thiamine-phosphate kinase [Candidatus Omnitrophica bacterium]|jgi:thiamine-monophosphate kinase|nr:thiamine-phosphate kinase [Candidatus Omnitrophota bacterium]MDD5079677.1 thiamine-phosphate kinase [Candidatus Omnitrophota bacterium]
MQINKLGEFGLIERIKKTIKTDASVIKGIGDDCAVLKLDKSRFLLCTCDMIIEGVDFVKGEDPFLVGRKALAISISDIAACAGTPRYCLVSLGLPKNTRVEMIDRIYRGMNSLAGKYKINIVGGDMSSSDKLTIDVTMIGEVDKKKLVLRSGAKTGDIIFVTGRFGGSIKGKHLKFTPCLEEARFLTRNFRVNSMIDASDGLCQDLGHILKESAAGAVLYEDLIPLSKEASGIRDGLSSGEDFELIFTLGIKEGRRLIASKKMFYPIGHIVNREYGLQFVDKHGRQKKIDPAGFRHY